MTDWTSATVSAALGLPGGDPALRFSTITTDTRMLLRDPAAGGLFVALRGERFDGHTFLAAARDAGATGAVVRQGTAPVPGLRLFPVADTLRAYGDLAAASRRQIPGPVVAITGTNGKTSTKEMVAAILRLRYATHATPANLNNLVGVPHTVLTAPPGTEALVVEAGASVPGEIARYREILCPDIAVVTNVAPGHLEGFGSLAGVLAEKTALLEQVPLAVVGTEPAALADRARAVAGKVVVAGIVQGNRRAGPVTIDASGCPHWTHEGVEVRLSIPGRHQVANAMLAWAVGAALGFEPEAMARALATVELPGGRGEIHRRGGFLVLHDAYNANPHSFRGTIDMARDLRAATGRRLVFIAGTMRELGPESARWHREVGEALRELRPEVLAVVGEFGPALAGLGPPADGAVELTASDPAALGPILRPHLRGTDLIVLKASRGVALERILPLLVPPAAPPD